MTCTSCPQSLLLVCCLNMTHPDLLVSMDLTIPSLQYFHPGTPFSGKGTYSIRRRQVSLCPAFFLRIEMSDLLYRPGPRLLTEIKRLWELEKETLSRWGEIISGAQTFCRKR